MGQIDGNTEFSAKGNTLDVLDLIYVLLRSKLTIFVFALTGSVCGVIVAMNSPPTYLADSLLQLEETGRSLALPSELTNFATESPIAETEIQIIKSRMVLGLAASRLNLQWAVEPRRAPILGHLIAKQRIWIPEWGPLASFARLGDSIRLDYLQVPGDWNGLAIVIKILSDSTFEILTPDGESFTGTVEELVEIPDVDFAIRIGALSAATGREFLIRNITQQTAIDLIRHSLSVSEQGRSTGILKLSFTADNPERSRRILDAISQSYLTQNANRSAAEMESGLEFLETQLPLARAAVQEAEDELNDFQRLNDVIDMDAEGEALISQIRVLENELLDLRDQEQELKERFTPNHPDYQRLIGNKENFLQRLAALRLEVSNLPSTQQKFLTLRRNLEEAQEAYFRLRNRAQELQVLRASNIGNVRIVDTARASNGSLSPNIKRLLAIGFAVGLTAGSGLVLLRSFIGRRIEDSQDLDDLGLTVFATLNRNILAENVRPRQRRLPIPATEMPQDPFVEGLRSLRTSMHFGLIDTSTSSILITSGTPGVGKSFISANFAVVAAQSGQRVCLVDGDMRRGKLKRYFDIDGSQPGLAQVLSGEFRLDEALVAVDTENLSVLTSGGIPPNPAELLMRYDVGQMIKMLNQDFDLIVVDSPPVLAVTDAVIISRHVGATFFVARAGVSRPSEIAAAQKVLSAAGTKVSGAILNGFDPRRSRAPNVYGYDYRYSYKTD